MDSEHLIGIEELDAQHKEIHEVATSLIEAIETDDKWHIVHYIVIRLYELLRFHFAVEESVMRIVGFPGAGSHKQMHQEILDTIDTLRTASLHADGLDSEEVLKRQVSFLAHIIDHDKLFVEFVVAKRNATPLLRTE